MGAAEDSEVFPPGSLVLLVGPPASGTTTYATALVAAVRSRPVTRPRSRVTHA